MLGLAALPPPTHGTVCETLCFVKTQGDGQVQHNSTNHRQKFVDRR
jgi:hypothetical protein